MGETKGPVSTPTVPPVSFSPDYCELVGFHYHDFAHNNTNSPIIASTG